MLEVRRLGGDAYPTLLHIAHGADRLGGGPVASADALTHALEPARGRHHGRQKPPPQHSVNESAPMPALTQNVHTAGDTGLNNASVPNTGERDAPLPVDGRFTLAEQHQILVLVIGTGGKPITVVGTTADPDYRLKEAMLERCPELGPLVFLDLGTGVAIGVTARG
ncbi:MULTISPECIES: MBL fold metallo-hydrolase [Streptomyces]|uniref:hypothetical protein n=1 Tax=Streptomyces TaxID=1883 RepID=UPI001C305241|nr:hypothetical protein [Streptomyces sp. GbtcB7]